MKKATNLRHSNSEVAHCLAATALLRASKPHKLPDGLIINYIRVSAANTVEVKFFNATASAIDPASMDWNIVVVE